MCSYTEFSHYFKCKKKMKKQECVIIQDFFITNGINDLVYNTFEEILYARRLFTNDNKQDNV